MMKKSLALLLVIAIALSVLELSAYALEKGDNGNEVKKLQKRLIKLHYLHSSTITGIYGDDEVEAIKSFQKDNELDPTGIADEETLNVLFGKNAKYKKKYVFEIRDGVKWGMSRDEVNRKEYYSVGGAQGTSVGVSHLYCWDVNIGNMKGDLTYTFLDDSLVMVLFQMNQKKKSAAVLAESLSEEYGDPSGESYQLSEKIFNKIYETRVDELYYPKGDFFYAGWIKGGTYISIDDAFNMISLLYFDAATVMPDDNRFIDSATSLSLPEVPMQKGDKGEDVRKLQQALIDLGYLEGVADGVFGAMTEDAIRQFQIDKGLQVTKKADNATLQAINETISSR